MKPEIKAVLTILIGMVIIALYVVLEITVTDWLISYILLVILVVCGGILCVLLCGFLLFEGPYQELVIYFKKK